MVSAISLGLATRSSRMPRIRARIGWDRALAIRGSTKSSVWRAMTTDLNRSRAASEYEIFARHYDGFTAASDYESWTERVLELARGHGIAGNKALDLACGTGNSFLPLLRRGFAVTGCDVSPAMLAEAAIKAPAA